MKSDMFWFNYINVFDYQFVCIPSTSCYRSTFSFFRRWRITEANLSLHENSEQAKIERDLFLIGELIKTELK